MRHTVSGTDLYGNADLVCDRDTYADEYSDKYTDGIGNGDTYAHKYPYC